MKGNILYLMKRWVVAALVFGLGLSLTSCGGKRQTLTGGNVQTCDGDYWQFDLELTSNGTNSYILHIYPVSVTADQNGFAPQGDVALAAANQNPKLVLHQVPLIPGAELQATVTADDFYYFDQLVIQPYEPGVGFLQVSRDETTICALPFPDDGEYY